MGGILGVMGSVAEANGILERIQEITADLGEAYAGPFSDTHPLVDIIGQAAKPKTNMPTLAEALKDDIPSRDVPSPFEEARPVPISRIVRHVSKAKRLSIPKLLAARHGRETSPFHMALTAATQRVAHARKARRKKKKMRALSHVTKVLASPMSEMVSRRHTAKRLKRKATKANAVKLRKHPSTKQLLKALQSGISGMKKA